MVTNYVRRYVEDAVKQDLDRKMVFVSGPRQSGKTTLARKIQLDLSGERADHFYLSWDSAPDREKIIREQFPAGSGVLVLDEIHKYPRWRQVVKGLFDRRHGELKIIVTGSGRLDYYRKGGESLQGRYHLYRLYPFSFLEIRDLRTDPIGDLLRFGGFPEPFLLASDREARRWSREYRSRLVYDDIASLESVREVALVEELVLRLPALVGSPLSLNSLREDLQVAHKTVARWLDMLERVYAIFRIYPFGAPRVRAVKKPPKHYHFDWTLVQEEGARFENLVAFHLLKWVHYQQDYEGYDSALRYFRTRDGREVDFVVVRDGRPRMFVECKLRPHDASPALRHLKRKFPDAEAFQVSLHTSDDYVDKHGIRMCSASELFARLV